MSLTDDTLISIIVVTIAFGAGYFCGVWSEYKLWSNIRKKGNK